MLSFVLLAHVAPDEQLALLGGATAVGGWNLSQARGVETGWLHQLAFIS